MSLPRVLLNTYDIYNKIDRIIKIKEQKTFRRDKLIINDISLRVKNFDDFFSIENPKSNYHGSRWRYSPLIIYNSSDMKIWDGIVIDIIRDHNTKLATIKSKDKLWKYKKIKVEYTSSDWETAATSARNIMDVYGYTPYNSKTIQDSINWLEEKNCYIKCNINLEDNVTFMSILEKLAEYAVADCYTINNEIYFKCWKPYVGGASIHLAEADLRKSLKVYSMAEKDLVNNYNVSYIGGTATDEDNNNIGEASRSDVWYGEQDSNKIDGDVENEIQIKDLSSAIYIGETLMRRTHINLESWPRPPETISFTIPIQFQYVVTLDTYFKLTFSDEGWTGKLFEPFTIEKDEDRNEMRIVAMEVEE